MEILTIGHSTKTSSDFIELVRMHGVELIVDVRTVPRSGHNPQFNQDALMPVLAEIDVEYAHMKGLGGFRKPRPDSVNTAWHEESFRGFADYMETSEFEDNLKRLLDMAERKRTAIMCAEAVPWRCHRALISDALVARGVRVRHIIEKTQTSEHYLTPWARVEQGRVSYPGEGKAGDGHKGSK